jgi:hypothetical protein
MAGVIGCGSREIRRAISHARQLKQESDANRCDQASSWAIRRITPSAMSAEPAS